MTMLGNKDQDRLKDFIEEAKRLHLTIDGSERLVSLSDVRRLLCNYAAGVDPDYRTPPTWARKDCTGYLIQRGWRLTDDYMGMHRRGYFIPAGAIEDSGGGGPESTADTLEIEKAVRTDRCGETGLPPDGKRTPLPADKECPYCVNNSGCNHCNPSGLPR